MPSRGSSCHDEGNCSPCVWNWKPQGCHRGQECGYCHLCPDGEIKSRKKAKLATIRGASSASLSSGGKEEEQEDVRQLDSTKSTTNESTPGSSLHGTGDCRPCAWFYKPQGCQNGTECRHCHLCPEGEIKARKKNKMDTLRVGKDKHEAIPQNQQVQFWLESEEEQSSPGGRPHVDIPPPPGLSAPAEGAQPLPSVGSILHGTGECRPCAWFHKEQGCQNAAECRHCHLCPEGEIKARRKAKASMLRGGLAGDSGEEDFDEAGTRSSSSPIRTLCTTPKEIDMEQALWVVQKQQEAIIAAQWQAQAQWDAVWESRKAEVEHAQAVFNMSPMNVEISAAVTAAAVVAAANVIATVSAAAAAAFDASPAASALAPSPAASPLAASPLPRALPLAASPLASAASPMPPMLPLAASRAGGVPIKVSAEAFPTPTTPTAHLPSTGSALHAPGKCRPCAWFWKPQGCQNGQACAHCHLCPEGELKERKRVKEAAMRMGALVPMRQGILQGQTPMLGRSPRIVKIAPILGA